MQIWAHRGASGEYPENTLLAFEQAILQGADGIELDVFQVENELYIWHDRYIVDDENKQRLLTGQSASWVETVQLPQGQHIPTLAEALATIAGRCAVNIEVKQLSNIELLVQILSEAVKAPGFSQQQLLISSFDHDFLDVWRHKKLAYKIGLLSASSLRYVQLPGGLFSVNLCIDCLREGDVQRAHKAGLKVYVYTVDRPADISLCRDLGVDGIFTNYTKRTRELI